MSTEKSPPACLRVQIASDLHLEFYDVLPRFHEIIEPKAPVLALLGDISVLGHQRGRQLYEQFLTDCCHHFNHVFILLGNHEFYSDEISMIANSEIVTYIRTLSEKLPKVRLLENEGVTIDGVRVSGTALWSDVPDVQTKRGAKRTGRDPSATVESNLNDYHLIYVEDGALEAAADGRPAPMPTATGGLPISSRVLGWMARTSRGDAQRGGKRLACVSDTNAWHRSAIEFLQREAVKATEKRTNMLVLTHHTPSFHGTSDPGHGCDPFGMSSAFSSNLEYMLHSRDTAAIHTWCFGHTHYNSDQFLSGVRLVSNQRGYNNRLAQGYRRDLVVEVPVAYSGRCKRNLGCDAAASTAAAAQAQGESEAMYRKPHTRLADSLV